MKSLIRSSCAYVIALAALASGRASADDATIVNTLDVKNDFHQLAQRLSMDLYLELQEIDAKFFAQKIRQYAALNQVSRSTDGRLRRLADETTNAYVSLESIHPILEPKVLEPGPILLALMSRMFADARIAADNRKLFEFKSRTWPDLLPYARKFSGSPTKREVLGDIAINDSFGTFTLQSIRFRNRAGKTLTNCTLSVEATDIWGQSANLYYFINAFEPDDRFDTSAIASNGTLASIKYSLYADELCAEGRTVDFLPAEICKMRDNFVSTFAAQQTFEGRWENRNTRVRKGLLKMKIKTITPPAYAFCGPQIDIRMVDPGDVSSTATPLTGTFRPIIDSKSNSITAFELVIVGASRTFRFRMEEDNIIGEDTQRNHYRLKAR
jgi:hypothetical protein